jgi:cyclase
VSYTQGYTIRSQQDITQEERLVITEIAPGIFSADHEAADGKNGIIFGEIAALAVDCGTHVGEGQVMADFIRGRGFEPRRLIYTHGHGDHILGAPAFRDADIVAHASMLVETQRMLPKLAVWYDLDPAELQTRVIWPAITFEGELRLNLGGRHVRLFSTPGHSRDGISVYVEQARVLFASDAVFHRIAPAIYEGDSRTLAASLARLLTMDIEVLVPGHGPVIHGASAVTDWLQWLLNYLVRLRRLVRQALDVGTSADDIAETLPLKTIAGERLPPELHGNPERHRDTVEKIIWEELTARNSDSAWQPRWAAEV